MVQTITLRKKIESPVFYLPELEMYEGRTVKLTISITSGTDDIESDGLAGIYSMYTNDDDEYADIIKECSFEIT
jgi:hypothetical protein